MLAPRTCHLPTSTTLVRIDVDRLGLAGALQCHSADIVVSDMIEPGGRR